MLLQLEIQNIALIDKVSLEIGQGLNVLTGETGAGKSIIWLNLTWLVGFSAAFDFVDFAPFFAQYSVKSSFSHYWYQIYY